MIQYRESFHTQHGVYPLYITPSEKVNTFLLWISDYVNFMKSKGVSEAFLKQMTHESGPKGYKLMDKLTRGPESMRS